MQFTGANWGYITLLCFLLLLAGCAHQPEPLRPARTLPVCDALIGPIKYNSTNPRSRRHAGPDLAPDLKRRNQVGTNLRCPAYR